MSARARATWLYVTGLLLAMVLTVIAFASVCWPIAGRNTTLATIFALAAVQAIVHFRCFLHIGSGHSSRHDLTVLLFSTMIVVLMVAGTLVVLADLGERM